MQECIYAYCIVSIIVLLVKKLVLINIIEQEKKISILRKLLLTVLFTLYTAKTK